jgi:hypothetical protein
MNEAGRQAPAGTAAIKVSHLREPGRLAGLRHDRGRTRRTGNDRCSGRHVSRPSAIPACPFYQS